AVFSLSRQQELQLRPGQRKVAKAVDRIQSIERIAPKEPTEPGTSRVTRRIVSGHQSHLAARSLGAQLTDRGLRPAEVRVECRIRSHNLGQRLLPLAIPRRMLGIDSRQTLLQPREPGRQCRVRRRLLRLPYREEQRIHPTRVRL